MLSASSPLPRGLGAFLLGLLAACGRGPEAELLREDADRPEVIRRLAVLDRPMRKPQRGDWLQTNTEEYESFDEYRAGKPNRPNRRRTALYVQPIGEFTPAQMQMVGAATELLGLAYAVPARVLPALALGVVPAEAQRGRKGTSAHQLHSGQLMQSVLNPGDRKTLSLCWA